MRHFETTDDRVIRFNHMLLHQDNVAIDKVVKDYDIIAK